MPPEVLALKQEFDTILGLVDISICKTDLSEVPEKDFSLLPYGDLPLGALKRTQGGLENELVVSANFRITPDSTGLKALEFVSWWVRDCSRGGESMQIRSLAYPPTPEQFGRTLRFTIDIFYQDPGQSMPALLAHIADLTESLRSAKDIYLSGGSSH